MWHNSLIHHSLLLLAFCLYISTFTSTFYPIATALLMRCKTRNAMTQLTPKFGAAALLVASVALYSLVLCNPVSAFCIPHPLTDPSHRGDQPSTTKARVSSLLFGMSCCPKQQNSAIPSCMNGAKGKQSQLFSSRRDIALTDSRRFPLKVVSKSQRYAIDSTKAPNTQQVTQLPPKKRPKRIIVLGGDGFCGWPTSLHLASKGHEIIIIDNLSRRKIDVELGITSLTPISHLDTRIDVWNKLKQNEYPKIRQYKLDIAKEYQKLLQIFKAEKPDAVIHFAEQRAAPYSMKSSTEKRYTVENNIAATNNVLCGIVESGRDIHLIHLGTMGVYGYSTSSDQIPEGYVDVKMKSGESRTILHPAYPGSIYHTTKCLDALLFQFYNKNDGVRITDLHQGIVWGTNTPETLLDERLMNRFDYDSDYGTVLNRLIVQSALGIPLTVYGSGGQTRAFINIRDTCNCIEMALSTAPNSTGRVEILNQVAETLRVIDLADMISRKTGAAISFTGNPRNEAAENELRVSNEKFKSLGLEAIKFETHLIKEIQTVAQKYKDRVEIAKIAPCSYWNQQREAQCKSGTV